MKLTKSDREKLTCLIPWNPSATLSLLSSAYCDGDQGEFKACHGITVAQALAVLEKLSLFIRSNEDNV